MAESIESIKFHGIFAQSCLIVAIGAIRYENEAYAIGAGKSTSANALPRLLDSESDRYITL